MCGCGPMRACVCLCCVVVYGVLCVPEECVLSELGVSALLRVRDQVRVLCQCQVSSRPGTDNQDGCTSGAVAAIQPFYPS